VGGTAVVGGTQRPWSQKKKMVVMVGLCKMTIIIAYLWILSVV
jgi:hypothetical protein